MKNQSVFILGTAYSGSTLLGSILNAHPDISYAGELSRYGNFYEKYHLDTSQAECLECFIDSKDCRIFTKDLAKKTKQQSILQFHNTFSKKTSKPVIIDGSKHVAWLRATVSDTNTDQIKVIILSRSPVEYLTSCNDRGIEPLWAEANAWRDTYYDALRTCAELSLPHIVVRFEDFIANRAKALQGICTLLNVGYTTQNFARKQQLHAIGGNPAAYQEGFEKSIFRRLAATSTQQGFDINPTRLKKLHISKTKKSIHDAMTQTVFQTPGLADVANTLGYKKTDIF